LTVRATTVHLIERARWACRCERGCGFSASARRRWDLDPQLHTGITYRGGEDSPASTAGGSPS